MKFVFLYPAKLIRDLIVLEYRKRRLRPTSCKHERNSMTAFVKSLFKGNLKVLLELLGE